MAKRRSEDKPKISKKDLISFVDSASEEDEIDMPEAITILGHAMSLIRSSHHKDEDAEPLPPITECERRFYQFTEVAQARIISRVVLWFFTGGLAGLIGMGAIIYGYFHKPIKDAEKKQEVVEELLKNNRRILVIMGKEKGWEIHPVKPEFKTPWEVDLDKEEIGDKNEKN